MACFDSILKVRGFYRRGNLWLQQMVSADVHQAPTDPNPNELVLGW